MDPGLRRDYDNLRDDDNRWDDAHRLEGRDHRDDQGDWRRR